MRNVSRKPLLYKRSRTELYAELGIHGSRIDPDFGQGVKVVTIGTVRQLPIEAAVYVLTHEEAAEISSALKAHRVWVVCPECNTVIPLSRIHQHYKSAKCLKVSESIPDIVECSMSPGD